MVGISQLQPIGIGNTLFADKPIFCVFTWVQNLFFFSKCLRVWCFLVKSLKELLHLFAVGTHLDMYDINIMYIYIIYILRGTSTSARMIWEACERSLSTWKNRSAHTRLKDTKSFFLIRNDSQSFFISKSVSLGGPYFFLTNFADGQWFAGLEVQISWRLLLDITETCNSFPKYIRTKPQDLQFSCDSWFILAIPCKYLDKCEQILILISDVTIFWGVYLEGPRSVQD